MPDRVWAAAMAAAFIVYMGVLTLAYYSMFTGG